MIADPAPHEQCFAFTAKFHCVGEAYDQGMSAGGNAHMSNTEALKIRSSLHCLPLNDISRP